MFGTSSQRHDHLGTKDSGARRAGPANTTISRLRLTIQDWQPRIIRTNRQSTIMSLMRGPIVTRAVTSRTFRPASMSCKLLWCPRGSLGSITDYLQSSAATPTKRTWTQHRVKPAQAQLPMSAIQPAQARNHSVSTSLAQRSRAVDLQTLLVYKTPSIILRAHRLVSRRRTPAHSKLSSRTPTPPPARRGRMLKRRVNALWILPTSRVCIVKIEKQYISIRYTSKSSASSCN